METQSTQTELNAAKRFKVDEREKEDRQDNDDDNDNDDKIDLDRYLIPDPEQLPVVAPSAVEANYVHYFAVDFLKPGHDQYIYRHANGLCVIGLAPTHVALGEKGGVTAVDFNVGRKDKSDMKVTGKRKKNAKTLQPDSGLCKVTANGNVFTVRCCVKGALLEVNDRLPKEPSLLNTSAGREGYVAIMMPKPEDWLKAKDSLLSHEEYKKLRGIS